MNNKIKKISSTMEKHDLYKENIERYERAKKDGYNYECLIILNNLLEDVVTIILVHLGLVSSSNRRKATQECKTLINEEFDVRNGQYGFNSFGGKLDRLFQLLEWSKKQVIHNSKNKDYRSMLISVCNRMLEYEEIEDTLKYIKMNGYQLGTR